MKNLKKHLKTIITAVICFVMGMISGKGRSKDAEERGAVSEKKNMIVMQDWVNRRRRRSAEMTRGRQAVGNFVFEYNNRTTDRKREMTGEAMWRNAKSEDFLEKPG